MIFKARYILASFVLLLFCSQAVSAAELCKEDMPCCASSQSATVEVDISIDYGCMLTCEHPPGADEATDSDTWSYEFVPQVFDPDNFVLEPAPLPEISTPDFEVLESIPPPPEILPPESWPNPPPTS